MDTNDLIEKCYYEGFTVEQTNDYFAQQYRQFVSFDQIEHIYNVLSSL